MNTLKTKINPYIFFVVLTALYMFTTLSIRLWPIESPNRIVGFFILADLAWIVLKKNKKRQMILLFGCLALVFYSFLFARDLSRNLTDSVYWLSTMMVLFVIENRRRLNKLIVALEKCRKFVLIMIAVCSALILVGLFDGQCYSSSLVGRYYLGYTAHEHTLCSGCCMMMSFIMYYIKEKQYKITNLLWLALPTVAIMASGARTFLISLLLIYAIFYLYCIKFFSVRLLLMPVVMIAAVYFFLHSSMAAKFLSVLGDYNNSNTFIGKITSGRSEFWAIDLQAYSDLSVMGKLFGHGFDYVYYINESRYALSIWAHNDVINLLLSVGMIGLLIYLFEIARTIKKINLEIEKKITKWIISGYILIPLVLNGYFGYQHYVYSTIILICSIYKMQGRKMRRYQH